jgi:hypothetical protein
MPEQKTHPITIIVPEHRATVVWPKDVVPIIPAIKIPRPIRLPRLNESLEARMLRVGIPDIQPIAGFVEVVRHFRGFVESLRNERDVEIVVRIFQQAGCAPEVNV